MLYQFSDNYSGLKTLDTENIDFARLCDILGIKREKERETVRKIIRAYERFAGFDVVKPFISREEIVTNGRIDFSYFSDGAVSGDSEGRLYFGNNTFNLVMYQLVEAGVLERKVTEETRFGNALPKPVFSLNPKKVYELIH